jgi:endonuclease/exonuclease/phosphatase (EEP) superfamily protein YafD
MIRNLLESSEEKILPSDFGLLCWNVHKQNLGYEFDRFFRELCERYPIDLLALQEVKINPNTVCALDIFHFSLAPNMRFLSHTYGVLNGSRIPENESFSLLSSHREGMIQTRKSAIFSTYPLHNTEVLLLVNLHAINFRATKVYHKEIEAIFDLIRHHQGAMIVTGDFNSWSKQRMGYLMKLSDALHLQNSEIEHGHLIKSFMNHKLDHIFYRGLQLVESHAVDVQHLSDHNALYARFRSE